MDDVLAPLRNVIVLLCVREWPRRAVYSHGEPSGHGVDSRDRLSPTTVLALRVFEAGLAVSKVDELGLDERHP